jgi:hypothetical protein
MNKLLLSILLVTVGLLVNQSAFAIDAKLCTPEKIAAIKRNAGRFNILCKDFTGRVENVSRQLAMVTSAATRSRLSKKQKTLKKFQERYCSRFNLFNEQFKVLTSSCPVIVPTATPAVTPTSSATPIASATPTASATPIATYTQSPKPSPTPLTTATPVPTPTPFLWSVICSYPAPPIGCYYVQSPAFNPQTQCGLILECGVQRDKLN